MTAERYESSALQKYQSLLYFISYLRDTTSDDNLLLVLDALVDLVLEVLLRGVLNCTGVEQPEVGLLFLFSYLITLYKDQTFIILKLKYRNKYQSRFFQEQSDHNIFHCPSFRPYKCMHISVYVPLPDATVNSLIRWPL